MSKPTLPQAISLLSRVQDKDLSLTRLEAHFDTGLISDLLDVDGLVFGRAEDRGCKTTDEQNQYFFHLLAPGFEFFLCPP